MTTNSYDAAWPEATARAGIFEPRDVVTTPERALAHSLIVLALITFSTAWVSELYFWPDEHWQVLEFLSFKLGVTPAADLTWEYREQVRAFMQPFLYWLIAEPMMAMGIRDMFVVVWALRLVTGALSMLSLWVFAKHFQAELPSSNERRIYARLLPFIGFLPYLFVRTAGETLCMDFFMLGLVAAVKAARDSTWRGMAVAGLCCGLAFETRFQSAFLTLGLMAWLILIARVRLSHMAALVAGGLAVLIAAVFIDHWGYGVWCLPAWNYLDVDILQGRTASASGSQPFFAFFYLLPPNIFAPIVIFALITLILACLRAPKHYVSWVTASFFLAHCLLAHKEERFLFPLAILATAWPILAFSPESPIWGRASALAFLSKAWGWRRSWIARFTGWSAVAAMLFCAVYPFGIRPHMPMAKYIYRHFPQHFAGVTFEDAVFLTYPIYRPAQYLSERLTGASDLTARLKKGPVYLFAETPTLAPGLLPQGVKVELLYSEFPFGMNPHLAPLGTRWICGYAYARSHSFVHPPRLAWMSLYRLTTDGPNTAATSPCLPKWNVAL